VLFAFGGQEDAKVLSVFGECQDVAEDGVGGFMVLALIGDTKNLALVCVELHEPLLFPILQLVHVLLTDLSVRWCLDDSVQ